LTFTRRHTSTALRLVGRSYEEVAQELQEFLENLKLQETGAIPGGFGGDVTPTTIGAGVSSSSGDPYEGWAAASHTHALSTAAPSNPTGPASLPGVASTVLRSDCTIQDIILVLASLAPDTYMLVADSSQPLGVRFTRALTSDEIEMVERMAMSGQPEESWNSDRRCIEPTTPTSERYASRHG
jgi:hypothetical protein